MTIKAKVTALTIEGEDMLATIETTNTDYPGVTKTFTLKQGATQSLSGYKLIIDRAIKMLWVGHAQPSWIVDVDSISD